MPALRALEQSSGAGPNRPDRLLFPLGVLLGCAGVLPWLVFALGLGDVYRPIFHSIAFRSSFHPVAETEGFLTCLAVACLFSLLPARTQTPPPSRWQVAVAALAPLAAVFFAFREQWGLSQASWLLLLAVAVEFAARRLFTRPARLPPRTVWILSGLIMGALGSALLALGQEGDRLWIHLAGRGLVLQGLFTGLAVASFGLLLPAPADEPSTARIRLVLHALGGAVLCASFFVEQLVSLPLAFALRAAVAAVVVVPALRAVPFDGLQGLHRRMAWIAAGLLPLGNVWAALVPGSRRAALHVVFLGCFALLVLALAARVDPPGTDPRGKPARPWRLLFSTASLAVALCARLLLELDVPRFHLWLGTSAAAFFGAALPWARRPRK